MHAGTGSLQTERFSATLVTALLGGPATAPNVYPNACLRLSTPVSAWVRRVRYGALTVSRPWRRSKISAPGPSKTT